MGTEKLLTTILLILLTLTAVYIIVIRPHQKRIPPQPPTVQSSDWFTIDGQCIAYSSPDTTYKVLQEGLKSAKDSILIGVYDFSASYIKDILAEALARQVKVSIIYDRQDGDSEENQIIDELSRNGANVIRAPSGSPAPFPVYHLKVCVVDRNWTFVQSGNFTKTSVPMEGRGNREMGLAVESRELADFFTGVLQSDIELARKTIVETKESKTDEDGITYTPYIHVPFVPELRMTGTVSKKGDVRHSLPADKSNGVRVRPVLTPDHYRDAVEQMLASAKETIYIQQQYIRPGAPAIQRLLEIIKSTQERNPGLRVRIMVRQPFVSDKSTKESFQILQKTYGWQLGREIRIFNPRTGMNCGNKLIVVDHRISLVGSANWSEAGVTRSREACLLIDSAEISKYYSGIFQTDWNAGLDSVDSDR